LVKLEKEVKPFRITQMINALSSRVDVFKSALVQVDILSLEFDSIGIEELIASFWDAYLDLYRNKDEVPKIFSNNASSFGYRHLSFEYRASDSLVCKNQYNTNTINELLWMLRHSRKPCGFTTSINVSSIIDLRCSLTIVHRRLRRAIM
jgi:hypothetical protein